MNTLVSFVVTLARHVPPWLAVTVVVILSIAWQLTLGAFDAQFRSLSGFPLLDLQNDLRPGRIITPTDVLTQIRGYGHDEKTLYWTFFTLDNLMPPLVFSSYALLWAALLVRCDTRFARAWLRSPLMWLPFAVGFFDWLENLGYVRAIHATEEAAQVAWVYAGLTFKWLKAACVIPTTTLTLPLLIYALIVWQRRRRDDVRASSTRTGGRA